MADVPRLHAQATRLILSLREGLERLEAAEVCRRQLRVPVCNTPTETTACRAGRTTGQLQCLMVLALGVVLMSQHGLRPGDPAVIAKDLQLKLLELQVRCRCWHYLCDRCGIRPTVSLASSWKELLGGTPVKRLATLAKQAPGAACMCRCCSCRPPAGTQHLPSSVPHHLLLICPPCF